MNNRYNKSSRVENRFTDFSETSKIQAGELPFGIRISVFTNSVLLVIGFFFMLLGTLALFAFGMAVSTDDLKFSSSSPTTEGRILDIRGTDSYENDQRVYEYYFEYKLPDGQIFEGICYHTGRFSTKDSLVRVQYLKNTPEKARIEGMKVGQFPFFILFFVAIFPLVGGLMLFFGIRKARKRLNILKFGKKALGTFTHDEPTNTTINKKRVYRLYFKFTDEQGVEHTCYDETHLTHRLRDEDKEWLVYNPGNPEEAVVIDTLSPRVKTFFINQ